MSTEIDTDADVDIIWHGRDVTVRVPLAGEIPSGWPDRYQALAHRRGVPAGAEEHPSRGWIIVTLPVGTARDDITGVLEAAKDLIAETDKSEGPPDTEATEAAVRDWWAGQRKQDAG